MSKKEKIRDFNQASLYNLQSGLTNNDIVSSEDFNDRLKCSDWIHHNQGRRGSHHLPSDVNGINTAILGTGEQIDD